ncbi:hypothetical protein LR48_Vigan04g148200 [Vigna angularis]|uniref:Uncharacterized protein n=1 Tax=Phaseolus angularis TaxID=3914 RepID=A0A0L9UFF4_PHAAN|nr:hypothetical protein LR48_Vigan04g148200 [Vigna angularis]
MTLEKTRKSAKREDEGTAQRKLPLSGTQGVTLEPLRGKMAAEGKKEEAQPPLSARSSSSWPRYPPQRWMIVESWVFEVSDETKRAWKTRSGERLAVFRCTGVRWWRRKKVVVVVVVVEEEGKGDTSAVVVEPWATRTQARPLAAQGAARVIGFGSSTNRGNITIPSRDKV